MNHPMESIITFLNQLAQASTPTGRAILEGGVLDLLLQLYLTNFSDPLAVQMFCGRLTLRKACDTLLSTFSKTEQGLKLLSEHQLYVLWPMTPNLQFTNAILDRPVKRAKMWRSINLELIHLRLTSILTIIRAQAVYRLDAPEFHPLSDIAHDSLEFLR